MCVCVCVCVGCVNTGWNAGNVSTDVLGLVHSRKASFMKLLRWRIDEPAAAPPAAPAAAATALALALACAVGSSCSSGHKSLSAFCLLLEGKQRHKWRLHILGDDRRGGDVGTLGRPLAC